MVRLWCVLLFLLLKLNSLLTIQIERILPVLGLYEEKQNFFSRAGQHPVLLGITCGDLSGGSGVSHSPCLSRLL